MNTVSGLYFFHIYEILGLFVKLTEGISIT